MLRFLLFFILSVLLALACAQGAVADCTVAACAVSACEHAVCNYEESELSTLNHAGGELSRQEGENGSAVMYAARGGLYLELSLPEADGGSDGGSAALLVTLTIPRGTGFSLHSPAPDLFLTVGPPTPVEMPLAAKSPVEILSAEMPSAQKPFVQKPDDRMPAMVRVTLLIDGPLVAFLSAAEEAEPLLDFFLPGERETSSEEETSTEGESLPEDAPIEAVIEQVCLWVCDSEDGTPREVAVTIRSPEASPDTTSSTDESIPPKDPPPTDETSQDPLPDNEEPPITGGDDTPEENGTAGVTASADTPLLLDATVETGKDGNTTVTLFFATAAPTIPVVCLPDPLPAAQARPTPRPLTMEIEIRDDPPLIGPPNPSPTIHIYAVSYAGLSAGRTYRFLIYMPSGVEAILVRDGVLTKKQ